MSNYIKTKSELLFEAFCEEHDFQCNKIPPSSEKTPDYEIVLKEAKIIVEVKQIDPNLLEEEKIKEFIKRGTVTIRSELGKRIRGKITDAQNKFSKAMENRNPSILVLYNNVKLYKHTDPKDILSGMYGQLCFPVAPGGPIGNMELGPNRKMTKTTNTSISAIGILKENNSGKPFLAIYHNLYASVPLNPDILSGIPVMQYSMAPWLDWKDMN